MDTYQFKISNSAAPHGAVSFSFSQVFFFVAFKAGALGSLITVNATINKGNTY
jgi:hypothetical protein